MILTLRVTLPDRGSWWGRTKAAFARPRLVGDGGGAGWREFILPSATEPLTRDKTSRVFLEAAPVWLEVGECRRDHSVPDGEIGAILGQERLHVVPLGPGRGGGEARVHRRLRQHGVGSEGCLHVTCNM